MSTLSSTDDVPWPLLGRYFAGELPPAERDALQRWIQSSPEHAEVVDQLGRLWADAPNSGQQWDTEAAVRRVMQPATVPAPVIRLPVFYREPHPVLAKTMRRAARIAAVVGLVVGGAWMLDRRPSGSVPILTAASEVRTLRGERASLRLPDGSEVVLGPASRIRYAIAQDRGPRVVDFEGEAYFTVTHDASRPFTVRTPRAVATDLGTRFGVRAHATDSVVEVVVKDGKVALAPVGDASVRGIRTEAVVLTARDLGTVTANGRVYAEHGVDVAARLAWTEGRLQLQAVPLRDAVVQLSRWYDLDIRLGDSASAHRQITGTFRHESATEGVQLIAATLELRLEIHGDTATLWTQ